MKPAAILVVVPTTGGPLVLRSLKARPGLPTSAAFAAGDYRPLPWSGDYARLSSEGGPLSGLPGLGPGPFELRLSGSFDAGRSWEAPVCLAHGLLARGHTLTAEPTEAGLVIWATGAVDLDLAILPGDYALLDKIERSGDLLGRAGQADLAILLPGGPEAARAGAMFSALGRSRPPLILPSGSVLAALDALARPASPRRAGKNEGGRSHRRLLTGGLVASLALAAVGVSVSGRDPVQRAEEQPALPDPVPAKPQPAILAEELLARPGSSCRRVAFGADQPERRPIPVEVPGRFRASRLTPDLCGLAFRPAQPGARLTVDPELTGATLPPVRMPDGAQAYYLREGARQNRVYTVQAIPEAGTPEVVDRLEHALVR